MGTNGTRFFLAGRLCGRDTSPCQVHEVEQDEGRLLGLTCAKEMREAKPRKYTSLYTLLKRQATNVQLHANPTLQCCRNSIMWQKALPFLILIVPLLIVRELKAQRSSINTPIIFTAH